MSESMSSPWIRDYLIDVAETHGAQPYNAPVSKGKKRVQLTDFLTYQENSYVWAWISDKDYRVSVRISKTAIDEYKSKHGRSLIDCRFSLVFIASYRPMFSPRPLGPNVIGNTHLSHISLEVGYISSIGIGGHLFGNPRDLESDVKMKEWVLGLREDGGGGNVLKLRKQQGPAQNKKPPSSPPSPPPFSLYAPVSQWQTGITADDSTKAKPERPQDLKRVYAKRWREIEVDPWKFAIKPAAEERLALTQFSHSLVESHLDSVSRLESRNRKASSPHRTPSPTSLQQQGTPTDWSLSNRGSPVASDVANTIVSRNGIQQHDESDVLPTTPHLPSDTEGHATVDTAVSDTHSLQPPTPAQRIKNSPLPRSSPPCSSPVFPRTPIPPSQQLPCSSPPHPSSSLPLLSSSFPIPIGTRKNIQRKVPHPGLSLLPPDPTKQGPVQVLVPNSDTSGTGSSQSYLQSQHLSQSQQCQPQSQSHLSAFSPSLPNAFIPGDASTPRQGKPGNLTGRASKMFAESLPTHGDIDEQETTSTSDKLDSEKADANIKKQNGLDSTHPPAQSASKIEILEVGTSDTEEIDELKSMHTAKAQDTCERDANADHEDSQLSIDDADVRSTLQGLPPHHSPHLAAVSVPASPTKRDTDNAPIHTSTRSPERPTSQDSMHSLFSVPPEDNRTVLSQPLIRPISQNKDKIQEEASPAHVPRHDSEAWKEPSFIAQRKGKGKARAVEELDTPSVKIDKKRQRSVQPESSVPKWVKGSSKVRRAASGQTTAGILHPTQHQDIKASSLGKIHSDNRPSTSSTATTEGVTPSRAFQLDKPRLANFVVDFERISLGKRVPTPRLDLDKDVKGTLLRTGRIRTLGKKVEKDGSVYIHL